MKQAPILLLLALLFAGCASPDAAPLAPEPQEKAQIAISGIVQDVAVVPIAGANVTIKGTSFAQTTGENGTFRFAGLDDGFYILEARAAGFGMQTMTFSPGQSGDLLFVMHPNQIAPWHVTHPFQGLIECAAEYVIITPSCDTITEYAYDEHGVPLPNGGSLTQDDAEFDVRVNNHWQTIVVDLVFDLSSNPGLEGLRTTVAGSNDPNQVTAYAQYGRFSGATSYRFVIEPEQEYPDGVTPVPSNATDMRFNIYGQGHGWHATCAASCVLGVGAGIDVSFDLYVSVFYVEAAPEGWSFQA